MSALRLILLLLLPMAYVEAYQSQLRTNGGGWWGGGDYVLAWRKERFYPPLVTTSPNGTAEGDAGVLGLSTTSIQFGDGTVGNSPQSGLRADIGVWATRYLGFGVSFTTLGTEKRGFTMSSNGNGSPIIARPFFNVSTSSQDAELIAFPGVQVNGGMDINTTNQIWGVDLYGRYRRFRSRRLIADFIYGFTYLQLRDHLDISTQTTASGTVTARNDHFLCRNNYYSGCLGMEAEWASHLLLVSVRGKVGLGNVVARTKILGESNVGGTVTEGGLLALGTNIGPHSRRTFEVVSMLNARIRFRAKGHLYLQTGYDLIYWPKVALAGEQIDFNLNITQQEGGTLVGRRAPTFTLNNKEFWAQGIAAGIYLVY